MTKCGSSALWILSRWPVASIWYLIYEICSPNCNKWNGNREVMNKVKVENPASTEWWWGWSAQAWHCSERERERERNEEEKKRLGHTQGGLVERHQEVITIGPTETGAKVTLSHVLPQFQPKENGKKKKGKNNPGEWCSEELTDVDDWGLTLMIHGQTPPLVSALNEFDELLTI